MHEINEFDGVLPEDNNSTNLNSFNKSSLQQYKLSLQGNSNITSHILLNDVWSKHKEEFSSKIDNISECVSALLQNKNNENIKTWKSNLKYLPDPNLFFQKSIPTCTSCSDPTKYDFDNFINNTCKCEINLSRNNMINKTNSLNYAERSNYTKTLSSDGEGRKDECGSGVFKPRFGKRPKVALNQPVTQSSSQECDFDKIEEENKAHKSNVAKLTFKTAKEQFLASNPAAKRSLGASRKAQAKFVSPMIGAQEKQEQYEPSISDDRLKHLDPKMIELIESEIIDKGTPIMWDDIAGLQMAKSVIQEAVVWPLLRPDIFTGLRRPPKGILLFGPPGTGKTLIGKCVAAQCNATFFNISASSLTSKWIGDGEKMVRALFAVAKCHQPAVIFIDEIDSLLTQRSDGEHEATRRIKTEFLVQFDGAGTGEEDKLLIIGATNRPQELDEAARRRLVKRLYIPLPEKDARMQIIQNLLKNERNNLTEVEIDEVSKLTDGYSGADMKSLCSEAAMGPIRSVPLAEIVTIQSDNVRPVCAQDFINALQRVRPSVSQEDLGQYVKWNKTYGQGF